VSKKQKKVDFIIDALNNEGYQFIRRNDNQIHLILISEVRRVFDKSIDYPVDICIDLPCGSYMKTNKKTNKNRPFPVGYDAVIYTPRSIRQFVMNDICQKCQKMVKQNPHKFGFRLIRRHKPVCPNTFKRSHEVYCAPTN
jgi:hypothetical protein